jgi:hypothetical protein
MANCPKKIAAYIEAHSKAIIIIFTLELND